MKVLVLITLAIVTMLNGCASKDVPTEITNHSLYNVIKKKHHQEKRLRFSQYELGVTEEKISASSYVITVKLDKPNTLARAKEMALYHGAILANEYGAGKFRIGNRAQTYWCNFVNDNVSSLGGPAFQFHLDFIKFSKSKRLPLLVMNTNKTIKVLASKINTPPSEAAWARVVQAEFKRCKRPS